MLIAQIFDLHLTQPGGSYADGVCTTAALRLVVSRIDTLAPRPDLILITGDIAADGLVAMHHPPFVTGMSAMDAVGLEAGVDELQALLERREDCLFVCGHVHRTIVTRIGAATAIAAPAMGFQTWLDLTDGRPALISTEVAGFCCRGWRQAQGRSPTSSKRATRADKNIPNEGV